MTNSVDQIKKTKRAELSNWLVENLRVTLFTFPEEFSLDRSYWHDLFKQPAEKKTVISRDLLIQESGPFEDAILKFGSNPTRIDWILTCNPDIAREKSSLPVIGPLENVKNSFVKLMLQWFPHSPRLKRLAFGAVLHILVDSREDGYRTLASYLKSVKLDPIRSSDLSYQINRPRKSSTIDIPNFTINRLTRWSVASSAPMQVEFTPEGVSTITGKEVYSCRLELDINTSAKFEDELPKEKMPALFNELVDLGMEIVREGDIP
jgi:hypothetical protein